MRRLPALVGDPQDAGQLTVATRCRALRLASAVGSFRFSCCPDSSCQPLESLQPSLQWLKNAITGKASSACRGLTAASAFLSKANPHLCAGPGQLRRRSRRMPDRRSLVPVRPVVRDAASANRCRTLLPFLHQRMRESAGSR